MKKIFEENLAKHYCINHPYKKRNHVLYDEKKPLMCGQCIHCLFMGQNNNLKHILEKYSKNKTQ